MVMRLSHALLILLAALATGARAEEPCGSLINPVGPWDYRTATQEQRDLVERFHFKREQETLAKGISVVSLAGDISYTLRAFPNHPRALMAMTNLAIREKRAQPSGSPFSMDCWFERAVRFRPDDGNVRLVYGVGLLKTGKVEAAIKQLEQADRMLPRDPNVHYNLGLAYFDAKDYEKSRMHAKLAYELGFPLPGLRDKLERVKQWN
jgi:predicted Zn-dependent protease